MGLPLFLEEHCFQIRESGVTKLQELNLSGNLLRDHLFLGNHALRLHLVFQGNPLRPRNQETIRVSKTDKRHVLVSNDFETVDIKLSNRLTAINVS